ncbi:type I restriction endonuclease subunit R [Bacillus toyonensis]|uniref:Type I restriction enzyme endonuclease subunit n=1 Tax=Bacillus toyonensis TaxID=155322 RepID=A0AB36SP13_9BACI|nr:HsdR family type I site-specific deoxyribonuclease [Bacillus toyonensis]PEK15726.1 type I restriction endonuclease [Bacillus toyonensis]PEN55857.1 type I restriction endonuclease [Bacillus toyonensis]PGC83590.1 type I restriction endonuclease [Bacillus toyonensis]PHA11262.1 type I restriction endonuclease [Bacillus toyonensis]
MSKFDEDQLEQAIVNLFIQNGYKHELGENIHRKYDEIILVDDLKSFLIEKYPDLTKKELEIIVNKIKFVPTSPLYTGNRQAFFLINEGFDLVRDDTDKLPLHIDFIDFKDPIKNVFKIVSQFTVTGSRDRRPDMLVFVNGIPVAIFEFKTAIKEDTTIYDAWEQIHNRYNRDIPNLTKYCFLSVLSDGANTKLGSIFTPYEYYYSWNKANDDEKVSNGISALLTMIDGAFAKDRIIPILQDFIYYPDNENKEMAIVCRYPQFFAANKMLTNIKDHLKPNGDGKGGTYFGATGCGKTYTMLFLSRLLATHDRDTFNSPTIIILVDRDDLSKQTSKLFESSKHYLKDKKVMSIPSRQKLNEELSANESGGVYITTIQKFCESTGLLSNRNNIICISDEAHRSQTNTGSKLTYTENGVETTYGFAKYLRDSFPNATYAGFTGTPIDETLHVFGDIVDSYTMKESSDDGITVRIQYEPRLARVIISEQQTQEIDNYYKKVEQKGSNPEQIEASKRAMSKITQILGHPDRITKIANDIVGHYDKLCSEKPEILQKAMIVCASRELAYNVYKELERIKPEWFVPKKTERDDLSKTELEKLKSLTKVNLVATQGKNDPQELFDLCGNSTHRQMLDEQFKDTNSNFQIAIVVDMWITGFDVPSLAVMYIDKPLQKHTLIQTISRVNRVFEGKDHGLIVDYIGIKQNMLEAAKKYGSPQDSPIDELNITLSIFRNHLALIDDLLVNFDANDFYKGNPTERLLCLNRGAEYAQFSKEMERRFMDLSRKMKLAYEICYPSGELTDEETERAQFYLAIRSIIYKQTKGDAPDAETMNKHVQQMVYKAISSTGVEDIINNDTDELFNDDFQKQLDEMDMPITKFNALVKLLRKVINQYGKTNKLKSIEFSERLKRVVEAYNNRDSQVFVSEVVAGFINDLSDELLSILNDLQTDKLSFDKLGISYEEKAFYDILVKVRDEHKFEYPDEKCVELAKAIKDLVEDKAQYADWASRDDIKNQLNMDLTVLLYNNGYPPEWDEEIFEKVMEQAENFKKYTENEM